MYGPGDDDDQLRGHLMGLPFGDVLYGIGEGGRGVLWHLPGFCKFPQWMQQMLGSYLFRDGRFRGILSWTDTRGFILPGARLSISESNWVNSSMLKRMFAALLAEIANFLAQPSTTGAQVERLLRWQTRLTSAQEKLKTTLRDHHSSVGKALLNSDMSKAYDGVVNGAKDARRVAALLRSETQQLADLQSRASTQRQTAEKEKEKLKKCESRVADQHLRLARI